MADLNSYFKKSPKITCEEDANSKMGKTPKQTKKIADSSDEEPMGPPIRRNPKRKSTSSRLLYVKERLPKKVKKQSETPPESLYDKIHRVDTTHTLVDPETFFGTGPTTAPLSNPQQPFPISIASLETKPKNEQVKNINQETAKKRYASEEVAVKKAVEFSGSDEKYKSPDRPGVANFVQALQRNPPQRLGQRPLPVGAKNCLEGLTFVITGILEYFERDDVISLVQRYGGKVTTSVSKRTAYLVVGREPGQTKLKKAGDLSTPLLKEEDLYQVILDTKEFDQSAINAPKMDLKKVVKTDSPTKVAKKLARVVHARPEEAELWVDRYRPKNMEGLIGLQGPKSPANKLLKWLQDWWTNRTHKSKKNFFAAKEDGSVFKAALLSGPPGIGKTTTAQLVCLELGLEIIETNASDTRNKKTLDGVLKAGVLNERLTGELKANKRKNSGYKRAVCIMDEVDGMSGNSDRGGIQELIALIKVSRIPIICLCNDRMHQKIRSLSNHCFDLRFQRPRVEVLKTYVLHICSEEGLSMEPQAAEQMIQASHSDIRQILNNLQIWSSSKSVFEYDDTIKESHSAKKDIKENIFEVTRKIFSNSVNSKMSTMEKSDLFFVDYSLIPLFVFENYPNTVTSEKETMQLVSLARAANSISLGALCENQIRKNNNWSLLSTQAILSCVLPSEFRSGAFTGMIAFPQWLGKNSTTNKNSHIYQDLVHHTQLKCRATRKAFALDYLPYMVDFFHHPLVEDELDGVDEVVKRLADYDLTRNDWDLMVDLLETGKRKLPSIQPKVKAAFTRTMNKFVRSLPYATIKISKAKAIDDDFIQKDAGEAVEGQGDSEPELEDVNDPMFKVVSTPLSSKPKAKRKSASTRKIKTK